MFGHNGDLVSVHTKDFSLQVDQLSLTHLHIVTSLQVVFTLLAWSRAYKYKQTITSSSCFKEWFVHVRPPLSKPGADVPDSVTTSRSIPSGWSSNFSSSDRVGFTPSVIWPREILLSSSQLIFRTWLRERKTQNMFSPLQTLQSSWRESPCGCNDCPQRSWNLHRGSPPRPRICPSNHHQLDKHFIKRIVYILYSSVNKEGYNVKIFGIINKCFPAVLGCFGYILLLVFFTFMDWQGDNPSAQADQLRLSPV